MDQQSETMVRSQVLDSVYLRHLEGVSEVLEVRRNPVRVPRSEVTLRIPSASLLTLPCDASYSDRSGQASVKLSRKAGTGESSDTLYVYASCDSLEVQCEEYARQLRTVREERASEVHMLENELSRLRREISEVEEKPPNGIRRVLKGYLYGLVSGVFITLLLTIKIKN